jgi:hypothetical protein
VDNPSIEESVQRVEIYSASLKITGDLAISPPLRLSDEVNGLTDYIELKNSITEPLLTSYPVVSPTESLTVIEKASVVLIVPVGNQADRKEQMWREKVKFHVVLNTTSFSMSADVHLEPRVTLLTQLERYEREFLAVTHLSAVAVASLNSLQPGGQPFTLHREFALVNPRNIVSFSVREAAAEAGAGA